MGAMGTRPINRNSIFVSIKGSIYPLGWYKNKSP